jgi:hypothetical protein
MRVVRYIACIFLITVILFGWGFSAGEFGIFPGKAIKQIQSDINAFIQGGGHNKKSITEKVANDLGLRPERMLSKNERTSQREYKEISIEGLKKTRKNPLIYLDSSTDIENIFPRGYILIWGAFDFKDHLHGGILIDKNGNVVHKWIPNEKDFVSAINAYNKKNPNPHEKVEYNPPQGRFPHGLSLFPDGSLIFNDGDPGNGMQKIDFCSRTEWIKLGPYNHVIQKGVNNKSVWTMDGDSNLHQINSLNGESINLIHIDDVIKENPSIDILGIRRNYLDGQWLHDRWHFNDIEPLPLQYKDSFPQFNAGDLLLSSRSLNAIMVLNPDTSKIQWWKVGATSRQHDPDWQSDGSITVYDNQMRDKNNINFENDKYSRIVKMYFDDYSTKVLYNGRKNGFYSNIRGKHQVLPNGNILITSSMQGRVFMVNPKGEIVFEFINEYDNNGNVLLISEAEWFSQDFFDFNVFKKYDKCSNITYQNQWHTNQYAGLHYLASQIELKKSISELKPIHYDNVLNHVKNPYIAFEGWSDAEPTIRWTEGNSAYIHFKLPAKKVKNIFAKLKLHSLGPQTVKFYLNEKMIKKVDINYPKEKELALRIPITLVNKNDLNTLKLEMPNARTPDSADPRALAIALHSMKFTQDE